MKARFLAGVLCLLSFGAPASAQPSGRRAPLPPDLAAVPGDALGFAHIRVADIWKSEALKELRETVLKAGDKALQGFDKRFMPTPSSIERLTLVVMPSDAELRRDPGFVAILGVNKPIDKDGLLKSAMPNGVEQKTTNGSYFVDPKSETAVAFLGDQVLAFGPVQGVKLFIDSRGKGAGPLTDALYEADAKRHLFAAVNLTLVPQEARKNVPPEFGSLLDAKTITLAIDLKENTTLDVKLHFRDEQDAAKGLTAVRNAAKLGRDFIKKGREEMLNTILGDGKIAPLEKLPESAMALLALGSLERLDAFLAEPPVKVEGKVVKASIVVPSLSYTTMAPVAVGLLLPAVQKVREAASRANSMNNLKQIGLGMHNHNDTIGWLPEPIRDKNGKMLLSWRVAILPFIEQNNLYMQFKLDEPWDSDHNKKLIPLMPRTYSNLPNAPTQDGLTHYRVMYGKDVLFANNDKMTIQGITDGSSNTILAFEAADPVVWTKPDEFEYDKKKALPKFGSVSPAGFLALFGDGVVRLIPHTTSERIIRLMLEKADGQAFTIP